MYIIKLHAFNHVQDDEWTINIKLFIVLMFYTEMLTLLF